MILLCFMQHSFLHTLFHRAFFLYEVFYATFISLDALFLHYSFQQIYFHTSMSMQHSISQDMFHVTFPSASYSLNMKHCLFFCFCNTYLHILVSAPGVFVQKDTAGTLTATCAMTSMSAIITMDTVKAPAQTCLWTETIRHTSAAVRILDINWHQTSGPALVNIFAYMNHLYDFTK